MEFKDYLLFPIMVKIATLADKAVKAINTQFSQGFGIGNQEIVVYSNYHEECDSTATLTMDGLWKYHDTWWGGRDYEIKCTGEGMFNDLAALIKSDKMDNTAACAWHSYFNWLETLTMLENDVEAKKLLKELREYLWQKE